MVKENNLQHDKETITARKLKGDFQSILRTLESLSAFYFVLFCFLFSVCLFFKCKISQNVSILAITY